MQTNGHTSREMTKAHHTALHKDMHVPLLLACRYARRTARSTETTGASFAHELALSTPRVRAPDRADLSPPRDTYARDPQDF